MSVRPTPSTEHIFTPIFDAKSFTFYYTKCLFTPNVLIFYTKILNLEKKWCKKEQIWCKVKLVSEIWCKKLDPCVFVANKIKDIYNPDYRSADLRPIDLTHRLANMCSDS